MYATYCLKANELDMKFIKLLKSLYTGKEIEIIIHDIDETDYLSQSPKNKMNLLKAIDNINKGKGLIEVDLQQIA